MKRRHDSTFKHVERAVDAALEAMDVETLGDLIHWLLPRLDDKL